MSRLNRTTSEYFGSISQFVKDYLENNPDILTSHFATMTGMSRPAVVRLVKGEEFLIRFKDIVSIAETCKVSIHDLLEYKSLHQK